MSKDSKLKRVTINQLHIFISLVDSNFIQATICEDYGLSNPTVSAIISRLSDLKGYTLFVHRGCNINGSRKIVGLTEQGKELYKVAKPLINFYLS